MISRIHISSFVGLTIIVWLVVLWYQGTPVLSWEFIRPFGTVVGAIAMVSIAFNLRLWRCRWLHGWYVNIPYLGGTWRVVLRSDWVNPDTNEQVGPIDAFLTIRQTLSHLSARLITNESTSYSIAYSIEMERDGLFRLNVIYRNEPKVELQGVRSEIHHGSFKLEVLGIDHTRMSGHYWTDRKTRGSMECTRVTRDLFDDWEGAKKGIEQGTKPDALPGAG